METLISNTILCTTVTVVSYVTGLKIFQKFNKYWLNPLYTVTVMVICLLSFFHVDYDQYTSGSSIFSLLLGTATVSLAVPLYKQIIMLKKHLWTIIYSVAGGTLAGVVSVVLLAKGAHLNQEVVLSLIPKSVTVSIALSISESLGGIPSLTVLFVLTSSVFSLITGPLLLKFGHIRSRIAKGLALGTSAQAIGASRAFEWGELEGAMGSIAIGTSALFMSLITPLLFNFYL
ncbi:LrgB family protein [Paenactinomyces guangxiensis]|uniref:LrgB family protein n=1 Tax=Paenactinomyces guangxiensis TaxID=1490290 RepID=A0A7W1WS01_9BACL|nr:LrgB family protein [Paenactinomyces guangxiensis]MBA4494932.1 LrgB family protein [Paenactinomyces guangxiensis]MBH8592015.1 LrgB family protein [Paenactinomyces guangxiensis]